jgi:hypothetical protein
MRPEEDCGMGFKRGRPMEEEDGGVGRVPPVVLWAEFKAGKEGGGMAL